MKWPHANKKPLAKKRISVQTPFSHSTLKIEQKKFHAAKPLAFSLHFQRQRPNTIQILWFVKKTTMSPIVAAIASQLLFN